MKNYPLIFILSLLMASCAWVKPTSEGENIRVATGTEVTDCDKLGKTTVSLKHSVMGVERSREKVQKELETLARNSAIELNGDTVVPVGKPDQGKQVFEVYKCIAD